MVVKVGYIFFYFSFWVSGERLGFWMFHGKFEKFLVKASMGGELGLL